MAGRALCLLLAAVFLGIAPAASLTIPGKKCEVGCPVEALPERQSWSSASSSARPTVQPAPTLTQRQAAHWFASGLAAMQKRDWKAAARYFDTARELEPDPAYDNQYRIASAMRASTEALAILKEDNKNKNSRAAELFIEAYEHWPSDETVKDNYKWAIAYLNYAEALGADRSNDYQIAIEFYETAVAHSPAPTNVKNAVGRMLYRMTPVQMWNLLPKRHTGCGLVFDGMDRACGTDRDCLNHALQWFKDICLVTARPG